MIINSIYKGAGKSLDRPTSRCIFYGENISFDASLVIYINSTNIPPIMIINRIYENQTLLRCSLFLPGRAKDLSAPAVHRSTPCRKMTSVSAVCIFLSRDATSRPVHKQIK